MVTTEEVLKLLGKIDENEKEEILPYVDKDMKATVSILHQAYLNNAGSRQDFISRLIIFILNERPGGKRLGSGEKEILKEFIFVKYSQTRNEELKQRLSSAFCHMLELDYTPGQPNEYVDSIFNLLNNGYDINKMEIGTGLLCREIDTYGVKFIEDTKQQTKTFLFKCLEDGDAQLYLMGFTAVIKIFECCKQSELQEQAFSLLFLFTEAMANVFGKMDEPQRDKTCLCVDACCELIDEVQITILYRMVNGIIAKCDDLSGIFRAFELFKTVLKLPVGKHVEMSFVSIIFDISKRCVEKIRGRDNKMLKMILFFIFEALENRFLETTKSYLLEHRTEIFDAKTESDAFYMRTVTLYFSETENVFQFSPKRLLSKIRTGNNEKIILEYIKILSRSEYESKSDVLKVALKELFQTEKKKQTETYFMMLCELVDALSSFEETEFEEIADVVNFICGSELLKGSKFIDLAITLDFKFGYLSEMTTEVETKVFVVCEQLIKEKKNLTNVLKIMIWVWLNHFDDEFWRRKMLNDFKQTVKIILCQPKVQLRELDLRVITDGVMMFSSFYPEECIEVLNYVIQIIKHELGVRLGYHDPETTPEIRKRLQLTEEVTPEGDFILVSMAKQEMHKECLQSLTKIIVACKDMLAPYAVELLRVIGDKIIWTTECDSNVIVIEQVAPSTRYLCQILVENEKNEEVVQKMLWFIVKSLINELLRSKHGVKIQFILKLITFIIGLAPQVFKYDYVIIIMQGLGNKLHEVLDSLIDSFIPEEVSFTQFYFISHFMKCVNKALEINGEQSWIVGLPIFDTIADLVPIIPESPFELQIALKELLLYHHRKNKDTEKVSSLTDELLSTEMSRKYSETTLLAVISSILSQTVDDAIAKRCIELLKPLIRKKEPICEKDFVLYRIAKHYYHLMPTDMVDGIIKRSYNLRVDLSIFKLIGLLSRHEELVRRHKQISLEYMGAMESLVFKKTTHIKSFIVFFRQCEKQFPIEFAEFWSDLGLVSRGQLALLMKWVESGEHINF